MLHGFEGTSFYTGATTTRSQLLRPYPEFGDLTAGLPAGSSWYNALTARVDRRFAHGFYGKQINRTKTVAAHDETGAKLGDTVRIVETRPLSKQKRWRVVEIIEKAK